MFWEALAAVRPAASGWLPSSQVRTGAAITSWVSLEPSGSRHRRGAPEHTDAYSSFATISTTPSSETWTVMVGVLPSASVVTQVPSTASTIGVGVGTVV